MPKATGLTVKELIELLGEADPELPVVFAYPSGDYWRTEIAGVIETGEDAIIEKSDYHQKYVISKEQDVDFDQIGEDGKYEQAFVLR